MSQQQWGHGYWRGVEDAMAGKTRSPFPILEKIAICDMAISNANKDYDRSLFPVREFIWRCRMFGMPDGFAKRVYDYVYKYGDIGSDATLGAYISGDPRAVWTEDYFVVPSWRSDELCAERDRLAEMARTGVVV